MKKAILILSVVLGLLSGNCGDVKGQGILTLPPTQSVVCAGNTFTLNFLSSGMTSSYTTAFRINLGGGNNQILTTQTNLANSYPIIPGTISGTMIATIPSTLSSGVYSIHVYPVVGGTYNAVQINVVQTPTISVFSSTNAICIGNNTTLTAIGATNYTWNPSLSTNSIIVVSPTAVSTIYTVSGLNFGCPPATSTISISSYPLPTVSITGSTSVCSGSSLTLSPVGANSYNYLPNGSVVSPTVTTTYSITGISSNNCPSLNTATINVVVKPVPILSISNSSSVCQGQLYTFTIGGANSYSWSTTSTLSSISVTPNITTTYSVVGTGTNGCPNTTNTTLFINPIPTISVNSGTICSGSIFTFTPTGAFSYSINGTQSIVFAVTPTSTTSYSITGTGTNGCTSLIPAVSNITVFSLPSVSVNSGTICSGSIFTFTPTGAFTYTYFSTVNNNTATPITSSSYSVTGTSTAGCASSNIAICTVTVFSLPTFTVNGGFVCSGSVFTINPSTSTYFYTYSSGNSTVIPVVPITTYTVTGTDAYGCKNSNTLTVSVNPSPTISVNSTNSMVCIGETATLSSTGANSYSWSTTSTISTSSFIVVSPTVSTVYTIIGIDVNGCKNTSTITQGVSECTGISKNTSNANLKAYPIPAGDNITIELSEINNIDSEINITIYSLEGKIILASTQSLFDNTTKIDVFSIESGVYLLQVKSSSFTFNKNIIISK